MPGLKRLKTNIAFIIIMTLSILFGPCLAALATTLTHTYDNLNRLVQTVYENGAKTTAIDYTYDAAGNLLSFNVTSNFLAGDIDNSQAVDLTDAILCLQVASGVAPPSTVYKEADINGDGKIGVLEAVYILQKVGEIR